MVDAQALGATPRDWQHFDLVLGLGANLLPVVADPNAPPTPGSQVKKFGKTPSAYDREGNAHGLREWTTRTITPADIARWSRDERLSLCVRTGPGSGVYAIDVDIPHEEHARDVETSIENVERFPCRERKDSGKFLLVFRMEGAHKKRVIKAQHGIIEFLGDGQQLLAAGTHPSGARYEWHGGLPDEIPTLTPDEFEVMWAHLDGKFGIEPAPAPVKEPREAPAGEVAAVRTVIDEATLRDLTEALAHPALVQAAGDNATWSEVGYALLTLGRDIGGALFAGFSQFAPNYEPGAPEAWWAQHETQEPRSDYRHIFTMAKRLGWRTTATVDDFPVLTHPEASMPRPPEIIRRVPEALHLCTDQRNANRLQDAYAKKLICVAGSFHGWTGTHWRRDDALVNAAAGKLSKLVHTEMVAVRKVFDVAVEKNWKLGKLQETKRRDMSALHAELMSDPETAKGVQALHKMEALQKWETECESEARQNRAINMLRRNLNVEASMLDASPHLFNCRNGTVDLRTGKIRPHDPLDFITTCAPVNYNPEATCPQFETFLADILDAERAAFMQRYLGYSITGETSEQKVMLHIGEGGNGKGVLFRLMKDVMGSEVYFHTAPEGLLTSLSNSERHPTEIAGLFGKRFVSAYESDENAVMREAFMKHLSGQDPISGRFMFKDFFTFVPVCKLHLQTNHEPQVRGTDRGIWRRLILIKYAHKYGTQADIDAGKADRLEDVGLTARLSAEREGILAWLVRGAVEWYASGLHIPQSITQEVDRYRDEQDRLQQFVKDRCTLDAREWTPFGGPFGLYPAYTEWAKSQGFGILSSTKFAKELARVVPNFKREDVGTKLGGVWRSQRGVRGVKLNVEDTGDLV